VKFARSNNDFEQWNNSRTVLPLDFMFNVYLLRGTKEFAQLLSMKQKKFESTVKNFGDILFEHMLSEYLVQFLSKWYDKINVE
jgi:hypothetical protein